MKESPPHREKTMASKPTRIGRATAKSESLLTTIPIEFVRLLGLKNGDYVVWEVWKDQEGKLSLTLRRLDM